VEVGQPIIAIDTQPDAGPLPDAGPAPEQGATNGPVPSAASLAAVEIAPEEGMVEPGLIGGPGPGRRAAGPLRLRAQNAARAARGPARPGGRRRRAAGAGAPARRAPPAPRPAPGAPAAPPAPAPAAAAPATGGAVLAKPPVRKLARDLGVDLYELTGTGPQGS